MRRRLLSAALSSIFIFAGALCFHQFYQPKGQYCGIPTAMFLAGQTTDQIVLSLEAEKQERLLKILNLGSAAELRAIPGITSNRIEEVRSLRPFVELEDIQRVHGIGPRTYEAIAIYASVF